jgi:ribonuclease J
VAKPLPKVKIIPLGGLDEIGKNMTVVESRGELFIIDSGLIFPEDEMLGIDIVIPDISFLKKNKERIRGILLTHGHEDHIGALPYVLREINVPVYGTRLTMGLVEYKLKEHGLKNVKLNVIATGESLMIGKSKVEFIAVNHSIPDAAAIAIHTDAGIVFHSGDFKIDHTPIIGKKTDFHKLAELGKKGVLLMMCESTNVAREGYSMSERTVGATFDDIFMSTKSRIIVATFASNVHRVQQIVNAASKFKRKVCVSGRSMVNVVRVAQELGYLKIPKNCLIDIKDVNKYPDNKIAIITTGSQGEAMSALSRLSSASHRQLELKPKDTVIISATPIPGNEKSVSRVVNALFKKGVNVIYDELADIHVSGHACKEELKFMHALIKPKFFMPVHGEFRHLKLHAQLASEMGMKDKNIFMGHNGAVLEFNRNGGRFLPNVQAGKILVDGLGVGDVGNIVLRDRKHLSEDGLIVIVMTMSKETGLIVSGPDIVSRGFVYVRESEKLMDEAKRNVKRVLDNCEKNNITDWTTIKTQVRESISSYLYEKTKRNPMILPIIMEI